VSPRYDSFVDVSTRGCWSLSWSLSLLVQSLVLLSLNLEPLLPSVHLHNPRYSIQRLPLRQTSHQLRKASKRSRFPTRRLYLSHTISCCTLFIYLAAIKASSARKVTLNNYALRGPCNVYTMTVIDVFVFDRVSVIANVFFSLIHR